MSFKLLNKPHAPRRLRSLDKELQALELRKTGMTFRAIGKAMTTEERLNGHDGRTVQRWVTRALKRDLEKSSEEVRAIRQLELMRLDDLLSGVYSAAKSGDTFAVNTALKIMERRSKMLGLDTPLLIETKSIVDKVVSDNQLERMASLFAKPETSETDGSPDNEEG